MRRLIYIIGALALTGCGPSEVEAGQAMLIWCIPFLSITVALERVFIRAKYRKRDDLPTRLPKWVMYMCMTVPAVLLGISIARHNWQGDGGEWFIGFLFWLGYCGYMAVGFVAGHMTDKDSSSKLAVYAPWTIIVITSAVPAILGSTNAKRDTGMMDLAAPLLYLGIYFAGIAMLTVAFLWAYVTPFRKPSPIPVATAKQVDAKS